MKKYKSLFKKFWLLWAICFIPGLLVPLTAEWPGVYPDKKWQMFKTPEEAGWQA
jgi:hypothetical protein